MSEELVIETVALSRHFGPVRAVDGLDLRVRRGDVYGFLGLNGSGKTTTLRCVLDLLPPTRGEVRLFGASKRSERRQARARIGAMVEAPAFFDHLTGRRNLRLLAGLSGPVTDEAVSEVLDLVGLSEAADRRAGAYSLGMKQRLAIALALVGSPEVVILDEPTNGLDPNGILEMRRLIRRLNRERDVTFLVSSHLIHEIELVCNRVAIIDGGRLVLEETLSGLAHRLGAGYRIECEAPERVRDRLALRSDVEALDIDAENGVRFEAPRASLPEIHRDLATEGLEVYTVESRRRSLEELFLELSAREEGALS